MVRVQFRFDTWFRVFESLGKGYVTIWEVKPAAASLRPAPSDQTTFGPPHADSWGFLSSIIPFHQFLDTKNRWWWPADPLPNFSRNACFLWLLEWPHFVSWLHHIARRNVLRTGGRVHYSPRGDEMQFHNNWVMQIQHLITVGSLKVVSLLKVWGL